MSGTYDVVLLVEQALTLADARQVLSLHEELDDPVVYHVLLPLEDAAARIEASRGGLSGGELMGNPTSGMQEADIEAVQHELLEQARSDVGECIDRMTNTGCDVVGEVVTADPIDALAAKVQEVDAAEAIILTRPHVVSEFFHLDWTSRARRKLGVPVLHLLEHENFDEQAGSGEGVTGM